VHAPNKHKRRRLNNVAKAICRDLMGKWGKIFVNIIKKQLHKQTCEFTIGIILYTTIQYYYTVKMDLNKVK